MSCEATPHVGQIGLELVVEFLDGTTGDAIDVSAASQKFIYLTSPSGTTTEHAASLDTTGVDGKIRYNTQAGDLSEDGVWQIQGWAKVGTDEFDGAESNFEVKPSRHATYHA